MTDGFRQTGVRMAARSSYAASGMCRMLRPGCEALPEERARMNHLVDRMYGLDDSDDSRSDLVLRRAARQICGVCPVRLECLADATVNMIDQGIYGGLGREERKSLARLAEANGLQVRDESAARARGSRAVFQGHSPVQPADETDRRRDYTAWLREHPAAIEQARDAENQRRRQRRQRARARESDQSSQSSQARQVLF
ncbi:MAG: WhiB family transcriptional regulator [Bifidobacterium tibiigranuli]|jgi:hypothetical protein|uniref:WhiB family transcriptional regulator n=1 Tax=Bifidobacterium tibiigranuli TaxID=2172043 RepID=UPI0026EE2C24|nr:WhiB family transcriptional regulator [Bifidobacterium tibiigranuli]MCI1674261.1 WhiB family transcriptional regulator [Bifidobacterium tibiigranuli]MCI1713459.1 WhiB family transcriptional regulator [Bifidobacterium tibiigranuli]